ncbi:hypothetical protein PHLGIDRAFT_451764 [Phlebiopsis gigantea 11061_1 CR5-6]|uniref:Uncharacterized protein n=1 Tax=Phlebiopsis gigantea (strain 11061_1 CR5-6) TaxID=745531 RepID=A0A0C3PK41_PHLG1|nr:hypothetical protein PHLGIDRAFT_451764 [Phlebiopsis gigantea 11061_1 CR5-6]
MLIGNGGFSTSVVCGNKGSAPPWASDLRAVVAEIRNLTSGLVGRVLRSGLTGLTGRRYPKAPSGGERPDSALPMERVINVVPLRADYMNTHAYRAVAIQRTRMKRS